MELSLDQDKLADMALSLAKSMVRPAHLRMPEFMRTTTFRWTLVVSGALAACILLMFGFVYWQTADYMTRVASSSPACSTPTASELPETS
jgi:hypothetical protein